MGHRPIDHAVLDHRRGIFGTNASGSGRLLPRPPPGPGAEASDAVERPVGTGDRAAAGPPGALDGAGRIRPREPGLPAAVWLAVPAQHAAAEAELAAEPPRLALV